MDGLIITDSNVSIWSSLVNEAAAASALTLNEEMESYLVFLLMRYSANTDFIGRPVSIDYMRGLLERHSTKFECMRDVGDRCLMYGGYFSDCAVHRMVNKSYYVDIGVSAYSAIAGQSSLETCMMYGRLSNAFVLLKNVLETVSSMNSRADSNSQVPLALDVRFSGGKNGLLGW